jgi:flavin-dependent dehydrogenase
VPDILQPPWKGTPRLTRHARRLSAERFFVLGDAASFVEPFTGEGISWALCSAIAVAPLTARGVHDWKPKLEKEWTDTFHRQVERRQMICRLTAGLLRCPRLTTMLIRLLGFLPSLSSPVLRQLNGQMQLRGGKFVTCRKELGQVENLPPPILGTGIPQ